MAALPTTHEELRARMEAAGCSQDQIAAVLRGPVTLIPEKQLAELSLSPPPYTHRDRFGRDGAPTPAERLNISYYRQPFENMPKITFKVHFGQGDSKDSKKYRQNIVLDGLQKLRAAWTVDFVQKTGFSKEPNMRMFRQDDNGNAHQICECVFHHRMNQNVDIKHPWYTWPEGWNPQTEAWTSDTGFLDETWMRWEYNFEDSRYPRNAVLVCKTVEKIGRGVLNEPLRLEVCRVILPCDEAPGTIELPEGLWKKAKEEQLDEMMSNAMINYWRRQMEWHTKPQRSSGGQTDTSGIASVNASIGAAAASYC